MSIEENLQKSEKNNKKHPKLHLYHQNMRHLCCYEG